MAGSCWVIHGGSYCHPGIAVFVPVDQCTRVNSAHVKAVQNGWIIQAQSLLDSDSYSRGHMLATIVSSSSITGLRLIDLCYRIHSTGTCIICKTDFLSSTAPSIHWWPNALELE